MTGNDRLQTVPSDRFPELWIGVGRDSAAECLMHELRPRYPTDGYDFRVIWFGADLRPDTHPISPITPRRDGSLGAIISAEAGRPMFVRW